MEKRSEAPEVVLPRRHSYRIRDGQDAVIEVMEGCVWLTQERDTQDYVVQAGETVRIGCDGVTYLSACSASRLRVRHAGEVKPIFSPQPCGVLCRMLLRRLRDALAPRSAILLSGLAPKRS